MKIFITAILIINSLLINKLYTYEINYKVDNTIYSTEHQLQNYENPNTIKQMYLGYLDEVCITPDTIWVTYKSINFK